VSCEVLVLSAHPDDAELCCSGTVKKLTNAGKRVVFVDATRGELGTRGTPELRAQEAAEAAKILGVDVRENLEMPDGNVMHTQENILKVVGAIRAHRPRILVTTPPFERHPDHEAVHKLARAASFLAGLHKIETERDGKVQEPHRPARTLSFMQQFDLPRPPDLYVDITETYDDRVRSIKAFASQFHVPGEYAGSEPETLISRPAFLDELEARARHFGTRIGVKYAEAFFSIEPVGLKSLADLL
jgi:N-acetylglucosamine malate deacetylase 1